MLLAGEEHAGVPVAVRVQVRARRPVRAHRQSAAGHERHGGGEAVRARSAEGGRRGRQEDLRGGSGQDSERESLARQLRGQPQDLVRQLAFRASFFFLNLNKSVLRISRHRRLYFEICFYKKLYYLKYLGYSFLFV